MRRRQWCSGTASRATTDVKNMWVASRGRRAPRPAWEPTSMPTRSSGAGNRVVVSRAQKSPYDLSPVGGTPGGGTGCEIPRKAAREPRCQVAGRSALSSLKQHVTSVVEGNRTALTGNGGGATSRAVSASARARGSSHRRGRLDDHDLSNPNPTERKRPRQTHPPQPTPTPTSTPRPAPCLGPPAPGRRGPNPGTSSEACDFWPVPVLVGSTRRVMLTGRP
jgi:hypothetical protein